MVSVEFRLYVTIAYYVSGVINIGEVCLNDRKEMARNDSFGDKIRYSGTP